MSTSYENQIAILAELFLSYKGDDDFEDFFAYNDIGLPLAYVLENNIALPTDVSKSFVAETFELLLTALGVSDDVEYEDLDHLFDEADDEGSVDTNE